MKNMEPAISTNESYNYAISAARLLAMAFIVACHFFQYYGNELAWWFNVGVQIFFCISGFLYGSKEIAEPIDFLRKNFRKILVPYFCFLLPIIALYFVFARDTISPISALRAVLCAGTIEGIGHLWFVGYILFCYLITPLLSAAIHKLKGFTCPYAIGVFAGLCVILQGLFLAFGSPFVFSRIGCYLAGYFLAFLLKNYGESAFKKTAFLLFGSCVVLNGLKIYVNYYSSETFFGFSYVEQYAHALLGITIFLLIYLYGRNIRSCRLLKISDAYSYYVYLVHQLFILSPFTLMKVFPYAVLNWGITLLAVFLSAVVLKCVSEKVTPLVTAVEKRALAHMRREL